MIEVRTKVKFHTWSVPNYATLGATQPRCDGWNTTPMPPSIPVTELEDDALQALAKAWLTELYDKAGRKSPFVIGKART